MDCTANTGGYMPCACSAEHGKDLCYYHYKMSMGWITPHREHEQLVVKARQGRVIYTPSDRKKK